MHAHLLSFRFHPLRFVRARYAMGLVCALLVLLMTACGFHMKGATPLPFDTLYTNISDNDAFGIHLRRVIMAASPNLRFVDRPKDAQAILTQLDLSQNMREISIGPDGLVEEYELTLTYRFQLTDNRGNLLLPPTTMETLREVPYDSNALEAKQSEINSLFQDMRRSLVDRVVRRLTSPQVIDAYHQVQSPEAGAAAPIDDGLISVPRRSDTPAPSRQ